MQDAHNQARALRAAGNTLAAIRLYQTHLADTPQDKIAWHNLASALGDEGLFDESAKACRQAFALGLDAAETWLVLARALQAMGQIDDAQSAYEQALDRKPEDIPSLRDHAQLIWMCTGSADLALKRFQDTLLQHPGNLGIRLALARAMGQMGRVDDALNLACETARLAPESDIVHCSVANAATLALNHALALTHARKACALSPKSKHAGLAEAQALLALGEAAEAELRLAQLQKTHPGDQYVLAMRATAWRLLGDQRYCELFDYGHLVRPYTLACPKGWTSVEQYVDELTDALLERHRYQAHPFDQSVKGAGSQITHIERMTHSPALSAWPQATLPPLRDYIKNHAQTADLADETDSALVARFKSWSIRLTQSGRHTDHVHPSGIISSACHILAPDSLKQGPDGWLRFGKPGIATHPNLEAEYHHRPEAGVIVFFPSYLWHGVSPFQGDGTRLTIAMDIAQN